MAKDTPEMTAVDNPNDMEVAFTGNKAKKARDDAMADIYARRASELDPGEDAEVEEPEEEEEEQEAEPEVPEDDESPEDEEEEKEEEEEDSDFWIDEDTGEVMTRVVIDGVEQAISAKDLKSSYQKDKASSQRFQQAAEKEKEVERQRSEVQKMMAQMEEYKREAAKQYQPQRPRPSEEDAEEDTSQLQDLIKRHQQALFDGDEEEGAKLMTLILKANADMATQKASSEVRRYQMQAQEAERQKFQHLVSRAQEKFYGKYKHLADDPIARDIANRFSAHLQNVEPELSPEQNLMKSGQLAEQYFAERGVNFKSQRGVEVNKDDMAQRRGRKKSLPRAKSSGRVKSRAKPDRPTTPKEALAEIAKARGQRL